MPGKIRKEVGYYILFLILILPTLAQLLLDELSKESPFESYTIHGKMEKSYYFFLIDSFNENSEKSIHERIFVTLKTMLPYIINVKNDTRSSRSCSRRYRIVQYHTQKYLRALQRFYLTRGFFIQGQKQREGTLACGLFFIAHFPKVNTKDYLEILKRCSNELVPWTLRDHPQIRK